ncbi:hypothetical protein ACQVP2_08660 [Methylobacterium aquaticum]|uniref:hypothetical protein n=1 Tax=Methylobacterium aquaticum TaxID=270351 RepID=UPI003D18103B
MLISTDVDKAAATSSRVGSPCPTPRRREGIEILSTNEPEPPLEPVVGVHLVPPEPTYLDMALDAVEDLRNSGGDGR